MKRIQPAESSRQGNSIESPSTSAISEEEETYIKLTSNPQDCKERKSLSKLLVFLEHSNWSLHVWFYWIHAAFQPTVDHFWKSQPRFLTLWAFWVFLWFHLRYYSRHAYRRPWVGWDHPLKGELFKLWRSLVNVMSFKALTNLKNSRYYFSHNTRPTNIQLHCFSDAASQDYAAVVHLCSEYPHGRVDVKIVASYTPVKRQAILRL